MIFMFLGVAAGVKLVCEALDQLHVLAEQRKPARAATYLEKLGTAHPYRAPVRIYTSREEGMAGEDEGNFTEDQRWAARRAAEKRFTDVAKDWPCCKRCHEPITNPKMIGAAT